MINFGYTLNYHVTMKLEYRGGRKVEKGLFFTILTILVITASTLFALSIISSVWWMASVLCLVLLLIVFDLRAKKHS